MMDKKDIIKIAKHVFKRGQGIPDKRIMHPRRDWSIGVLIFALILIVGSYISAESFSQYRDIDTAGGEAGVRVPKYQEESVKMTIEKYNELANSYHALVSDKPVIEEIVSSSTTEEVSGNTQSTSTPITGNDVMIMNSFPEKIVYTDQMDVDQAPLIAHCSEAGGQFNTCGSVCSATAEECDSQCAYTCELANRE